MKAQTQRRLRQYHHWLGLFFAPSIIFFALSGSMQSLGLHDRSAGYQPPAWLSMVANLHKHGALWHASKPKDEKAGAAAPQPPRPKAESPRPMPGALQIFTAVLGIILAGSTVLGIWIAFAGRTARPRAAAILAAGILVPLALMLL